jgi:large subunit ribosomal protein L14e
MTSLEIGRVCMKVAGREAGKYCVVTKKLNEAFVEVTGPKLVTGVKRRRSNIEHLEPSEYLLSIKEGATDEEVISAYHTANLVSKLDLKFPSAAEMKAENAKPAKEEKKEVKKEEKAKKETKEKKEEKKHKEKK